MLAVAFAALGAAVGMMTPAQAGAIAVTTTLDEHNNQPPCSLREAIRSANTDLPIGGCAAGSGADTITLPPGTYVLGIANLPTEADEDNAITGDLDIRTGDLTIQGAGAATTIVDGNGAALADRVFNVRGPITVSFNEMTIRNGSEPTGAAGGGGVSNEGKTTFTETIITGNGTGSGGGGVSNATGAASTFVNSAIVGNFAAASGGGVRIGLSATSIFVDTTVGGNTANVSGGGVSNNDGVASFANSTVSGNAAVNEGGGIFNSLPATSIIVNSTISGNRSNQSGGGVHGGTTTLANATVTLNMADSDANGMGDGGGAAGTALTVKNSIIGGNTDSSPPPAVVSPDCQATVTSQGYNLIGTNAGCTITAGAGDKVGTAAAPIVPGLAPLADKGGPTLTHALLAASPAHSAGSPAPPGGPGDACTATDQRGVPRPQGGGCDMGAYEAAVCFNAVANRVGTPGNDVLRGTAGPDVFLGFGGNDRIKGLAGNDRACGGSGKDTLIGGKGADRLAGGDRSDRLFGGDGPDQLRGGGGADFLVGAAGRDRCAGGPQDDRAASCEREGQIP